MSNIQLNQGISPRLSPSEQMQRRQNSTTAGNTVSTQNVNSIPSHSIYQYPQTNIYPAAAPTVTTQEDGAVVLNPTDKTPLIVNINNPSGYMGPNYYNQQYNPAGNPSNPAASSPIAEDKPKKTKRIVELTDDYIKTLENYLRNENKDIRMSGVKELVKRFEEDKSRFDDPALTALLNIALQDKSSKVRSLALSLADSGIVKGNEKTMEILKGLTTGKSNYGIDATAANSALLKMSATTKLVEDDSDGKKNTVVYKL